MATFAVQDYCYQLNASRHQRACTLYLTLAVGIQHAVTPTSRNLMQANAKAVAPVGVRRDFWILDGAVVCLLDSAHTRSGLLGPRTGAVYPRARMEPLLARWISTRPVCCTRCVLCWQWFQWLTTSASSLRGFDQRARKLNKALTIHRESQFSGVLEVKVTTRVLDTDSIQSLRCSALWKKLFIATS